MWKNLLPFAISESEAPEVGTPVAAAGPERNGDRERAAAVSAPAPGMASFDEIYRGVQLRSSKSGYTILKVADMANSPHLEGMSPEARRCSLMMALDAAGIAMDDLLQDAMVRQRALNDYETTQENALKEFEGRKIEENGGIQAELDRLTAQYMRRIQANLDEVARQQDLFHAWQKQKQQETRRISDAASICVPQGTSVSGDSLTLVLERVTGPKR
jgi:hypothetical protein